MKKGQIPVLFFSWETHLFLPSDTAAPGSCVFRVYDLDQRCPSSQSFGLRLVFLGLGLQMAHHGTSQPPEAHEPIAIVNTLIHSLSIYLSPFGSVSLKRSKTRGKPID